jgi:hypothetical protein
MAKQDLETPNEPAVSEIAGEQLTIDPRDGPALRVLDRR